MTSTRSKSRIKVIRGGYRHKFYLFGCILMLAWAQAGFAAGFPEFPEISEDGAEAWLVTFGPGEIYWERFGHNAIWLREPAAGLDHTFNFGYFDFDQEDFFLRFMRGHMLYFSVAQPAIREFEFYRQDNRDIRVQKLNLSPAQYGQLRDYLLNEIKPENRDYRYDYYLNNCSTRIRDALDIALDGALSSRTRNVPAKLNFRDQTRRMTQIPMVVADEIAAMSREISQAGDPLVPVDTMHFTATSPPPANAPASTWHRYLILGLLVTGLAWLSGKLMPPVWLEGLCLAWVLNAAIIGFVLAALWLLTDHEVTRPNANLLLFNPLLLLALLPLFRRLGAILLVGGTAVACLLLLLPQHQYNLNVLALVAPVHLAVAAYFMRGKSK
jgi:hypothetical protein